MSESASDWKAKRAANEFLHDEAMRELQEKLDAANERIQEMQKFLLRTEAFINRFFDPEDLGYVVSTVVRDDAREALGRERVESGSRVSKI